MTTKRILKQILLNQRDIMIWISKGESHKGFFSKRLQETEELLK